MSADRLLGILKVARFQPFLHEADLHRAIMKLCADSGIPFQHEVRIPGVGRIDFIVERTGIECKIGRFVDRPRALAQLQRYLSCGQFDRVILVAEGSLREAPEGIEFVSLNRNWGITT